MNFMTPLTQATTFPSFSPIDEYSYYKICHFSKNKKYSNTYLYPLEGRDKEHSFWIFHRQCQVCCHRRRIIEAWNESILSYKPLTNLNNNVLLSSDSADIGRSRNLSTNHSVSIRFYFLILFCSCMCACVWGRCMYVCIYVCMCVYVYVVVYTLVVHIQHVNIQNKYQSPL